MYQLTTATKKIAALTKRIRIIQGGTSASKTISILLWLIDRAQQQYPQKELTSIVAESIPHLKRGALRDFKNIMTAHGYWRDSSWNSTDSIYTFESGNQIEFFSSDNGDKLRGARRDWLFMNEANNMGLEAFEQLEVRTRKGIFIDYNPTNEFWVQTELIGRRNDIDFVILTYKDNESCPPEIVAAIEQRRNRPGWWKVYGEGQLGEVEGRIYTNWQEIDEIPHEARLERRGIDFGYFPDPVASLDVYRWNNALILDELVYQLEMSNRELANTLKLLPRVLHIADCAEPKSIAELRMYGLNVQEASKGHDSVAYGIKVVQDQQIFVTRRSSNLLKEYRNYLWAVDKDGKIIPGVPDPSCADHLLDAGRYAITSLVPVMLRREMSIHAARNNKTKSNVGL